jgi:hypothetical protein
MKISIKNIINPQLPVKLLLIVFCLGIWIVSFLVFPLQPEANSDSITSVVFSKTISNTPELSLLISLIVIFFNGLLIAQLNNKYTLIRNRTFLPVFFFIFLLSSWSELQTNYHIHIATCLFLLSLFVVFGIYRNRNHSESAFTSSLMIALAGLFVFPIVLLIPVYWIGMIQMKGFSFRTFLASVLGALTPWLILFAGAYYFTTDFQWIIQATTIHWGFSVLETPLYEKVYLGAIFLTGVLTLGGLLSDMNKDSLQTRSYIIFLITLLIAVFILSMTIPLQYKLLIPIVAAPFSILISYPLTLKHSNFYSILFYVFCLINLAFFVIKLIEQLQWI